MNLSISPNQPVDKEYDYFIQKAHPEEYPPLATNEAIQYLIGFSPKASNELCPESIPDDGVVLFPEIEKRLARTKRMVLTVGPINPLTEMKRDRTLQVRPMSHREGSAVAKTCETARYLRTSVVDAAWL